MNPAAVAVVLTGCVLFGFCLGVAVGPVLSRWFD